MSKSKYNYAVREAQSKAKQKEFGIEKSEYPHFKTDSDDLDFQCIFSVVKYAQSILNGIVSEDLKRDLDLSATYFDSALNYDEKQQYSNEYLLFGASAYFFANNFGNALTLLNRVVKEPIKLHCERRLAYLLASLLSTDVGALKCETDRFYRFVDSYVAGEEWLELNVLCKEIDEKSICQGLQLDSLFNLLVRALIKMSAEFLTSKLLPQYSGIDFDKITYYMNKDKLPVLLWPSQIKIGEAGGYLGKNLIVQAPTGSGKTKSIEFIIATAFASEKAKNAVVVAPLRSLCEEISASMKENFKNVNVNVISDILQENDFKLADSNNILVLTPEKLEYIIFHNQEVLNLIDVFVFDEGHMIDDDNRGPSFELLLTHIKSNAHEKQMVFISAVIPNGDQLGEWLFKGVDFQSLSYSDIPSTSKHIAVLGKNDELNFYKLNDFSERDFFVRNSIKTSNILTKHGRASVHNFPENTTDIALYYANLLISNGSMAIYFASRKRIDSSLKRINYLRERNLVLNNIVASINKEKIVKLLNLIEVHYGCGEYYKAAQSGVLVHYADLEEGLKKTAEEYLKHQYIKVILCTSTLSEGVNLPIKYLLMPETSNYTYDLSTRKLINLIGRAARSGHYTEGSIIVTEKVNSPSDLENKFANKHNENCVSCFCDIVNDNYDIIINELHIGYLNIYNLIVESFGKKDYFLYDLQKDLVDEYKTLDFGSLSWAKDKFIIKLSNIIEKSRSAIEAIVVFIQNIVYSTNELKKEEIENLLVIDINEIYGCFLMSEEERTRLINLVTILFDFIYEKTINVITNYKYIPVAKITDIERIISWNNDNNSLLCSNEEDFVESLGRLYYEMNPSSKVSCQDFLKILCKWISGLMFVDIAEQLDMKIILVEQICKKSFSYGLTMYFGHLIDINDNSDDIEKLQLLQKRVKYGLPGKESINYYEAGITDRYICQKLLDDSYFISNGFDKEAFLELYPDWILYRYNNLSKG